MAVISVRETPLLLPSQHRVPHKCSLTLCKLHLCWSSSWLVHRKHSITLLPHGQWCQSKWSMCRVSGVGIRVNIILDKGVSEGDRTV